MSEFNGFDLYNNAPDARKLNNPETKKDDDDDDNPETVGRKLDRKVSRGGKNEQDEKKPEQEKERLFTHLTKPETTDAKEAPENSLSEEEQKEVIQESAAQWRADVQQELEELEPGSPEAQAAEVFLQDLVRIEETGVIHPEELDVVETAERGPVALDEVEGEILLSDNRDATAEDDDAAPASNMTTPAVTPPLATGGGNNAGNQPPNPPGPPTPPGPPSPGPSNQGRPFAFPVPQRQGVPNQSPLPALRTANRNQTNPNLYNSADLAYYERKATIHGLWVGGIVGYLIGRRRGRIKTEKRLMPIQQKLEKEVKSIQGELAAREYKIRTLAYERLPEKEDRKERIVPLPRRVIDAMPERPVSRLGLEKPARIERLGKAVIKAEAPLEVKPELRSITPEHVKAMNRNELLLLSEKVIVEGASLRQIYEQHLVGERGLRHLLSEYLQGKDIRKDLRNEMVEREIDFERDPMLRDTAMHSSGDGNNGNATSLQQLLEKAGATATPDDGLLPAARLQAVAREEAKQRQKQHRMIFDTAMVTLIVVLAIAVTILILKH